MGYRLLGIVVWKAGKWFLRRKYGAARAPKPLIAGGAALLVAGIVLGARGIRGGDDG